MDRNEILHDTRHIGDPPTTLKMISKPMVRSVQTVDLSDVKISTISNQTESDFYLSLIT
jgi:hypothetical protein